MIILGIETSCDETAIAVLEVKRQKSKVESFKILSNVVSSQVKLHAKFGGVVPNLAAREHEKNLPRVLKSALKNSKFKITNIDLIAVTRGPGLSPSLWRGINFAKEISEKYKKPIIGVNHLEGHIYSNWLETILGNSKLKILNSKQSQISNLKSQKIFPILNLIVSGGHTELVLMSDHGKYKIIGETLDDAVGEAFDKVARLLGLGYPGGPAIAKRASQWKLQGEGSRGGTSTGIASETLNSKSETPHQSNPLTAIQKWGGIGAGQANSKFKTQNSKHLQIEFPRPMINSKNYDFSYSGLKTAVLYKVRDIKNAGVKMTDDIVNKICYEFQNAALDVLIVKTSKAAQEYKVKSIFLSGGVSANKELRERLSTKSKELGVNYSQPEIEYTGDNATMIAIAGYVSSRNKELKDLSWDKIEMDANLGF